MKEIVSKYIPSLEWIPNYKTNDLKGDLIAGLTVGVMLIPQGMAYAMIAGLPPIYGLYASIIPLIIYAFLGTSRQLAVGPVAMVSLLIATGVGQLAETGSESYIALAVFLALIVGLLQFGMGLFRLGFLVNFLSHPVISGFTSAAALIIGFSQLKHLLGVDIPRSHHVHEIIMNAVEKIPEVNMTTFLIGLGGVALILLAKRIHKALPGPLLAVVFGVFLVWIFQLNASGVAIVGSVPDGLPAMSVPTWDSSLLGDLLPIALTIALVGFMESIAVAKAIQAKHGNYKVIPNQELISLGAANIAGSFFQAFPVTGGFSRTAVNDQAGAKTGVASIISALLIALTLLFLTPLFYFLPKAILASVIMVAVFGLIDIKEALHLWHADRRDFVMLVVTFLATLFLGIEQGILTGVVLSLGVMIYQSTRPHMAELGRIPGTIHYRNVDRFKDLEVRPEILAVRFDARLYFANSQYFLDNIEDKIKEKGDDLRLLILSSDSVNDLDSTGIQTLEKLWSICTERDIELCLVDVKGPVRDALQRSGLMDKLGPDRFYMTIQDAVNDFDDKLASADLTDYVLQSND